jgi:hypothetical protein
LEHKVNKIALKALAEEMHEKKYPKIADRNL